MFDLRVFLNLHDTTLAQRRTYQLKIQVQWMGDVARVKQFAKKAKTVVAAFVNLGKVIEEGALKYGDHVSTVNTMLKAQDFL